MGDAPSLPNSKIGAEDGHANFYDARVNLRSRPSTRFVTTNRIATAGASCTRASSGGNAPAIRAGSPSRSSMWLTIGSPPTTRDSSPNSFPSSLRPLITTPLSRACGQPSTGYPSVVARRTRHAGGAAPDAEATIRPARRAHRRRPRWLGLRAARHPGQPLHALRQDKLPLQGRTAGPARALPTLDPDPRRQDRDPHPHPGTGQPLPTLVRQRPTPARAHHRTRRPLAAGVPRRRGLIGKGPRYHPADVW